MKFAQSLALFVVITNASNVPKAPRKPVRRESGSNEEDEPNTLADRWVMNGPGTPILRGAPAPLIPPADNLWVSRILFSASDDEETDGEDE